MLKVKKTYGQNLLIFYSESESNFSNFVINSLSSKSKYESDDSESGFNSVFMNFDICVFLPYIFTLLNNLRMIFLSKFITESIVMREMQV